MNSVTEALGTKDSTGLQKHRSARAEPSHKSDALVVDDLASRMSE